MTLKQPVTGRNVASKNCAIIATPGNELGNRPSAMPGGQPAAVVPPPTPARSLSIDDGCLQTLVVEIRLNFDELKTIADFKNIKNNADRASYI